MSEERIYCNISLWQRRRVSIFQVYIQTSCCLVRSGWRGRKGSTTPMHQHHFSKLVKTLSGIVLINATLTGSSVTLPLDKMLPPPFKFQTFALRSRGFAFLFSPVSNLMLFRLNRICFRSSKLPHTVPISQYAILFQQQKKILSRDEIYNLVHCFS